jgi:DNA polymerase-3 subunit delta'
MQTDSTIHPEILQRFRKLSDAGLLAHAYLFTGVAEIGKTQTALAVAKLLNCEAGGPTFCGNCASCRKIEAGNHPDVVLLQRQADATKIKIEQVRELLGQARYMPFEAQKKIFIIKNIEEMNDEASNALLKTLEEPTRSSLLILTTSVPEAVLATVRSRCHVMAFLPASGEAIIQQLEGEFVEPFASAHFLAYFAEGCPAKARRLRGEGFFVAKNDYLDEMLQRGGSDQFIGRIGSDKDQTLVLLSVLLSWIRDCMLLKAGVNDERLVHLDRKKDLEDFQARFSFSELNAIYRQIVSTTKQAKDNLNVKMALIILGEMLHG